MQVSKVRSRRVRTAHDFRLGDTLEVTRKRGLPAARSGTEWKVLRAKEGRPPSSVYQLVAARPAVPSRERRTVTDVFDLPQPRDGSTWRFVAAGAGGFTYQLVSMTSRGLTARDQMAAAFKAAVNDGVLEADEARKIVAKANGAGGADDLRITTLWKAVSDHSSKLTAESARVLRAFLSANGVPE